MKRYFAFAVALALLPLSAQAMKFQLEGSSSKLSYDVVKHLPLVGAVAVHGDLGPEGAAALKGALTTTDTPDAQGHYIVNGQIVLQNPEFVTDSQLRDKLVHDMIDRNGITVNVSNVRASAQPGASQTSSVSITINGITEQVPLTYSLIVASQGAGHLVTMRGQMVVDRSKFNMSIHGLEGAGDSLIDKNFILKFELPFRN